MMVDDLDHDDIWCEQTIHDILNRKHRDLNAVEKSLYDLRQNVLSNSCPPELRGKVWKLLLGVYEISASSYIYLVELGPNALDDKIRNDTFRTMTTDTKFVEQVSEDTLIRVLNAFVWTNDEKNARANTICQQFNSHKSKSLTYVQGMNVLAAPFLMALPEMEAFYAYSTFIWKWCPLYVQPTMRGVHCGLRLLDLCLRSLDPTLYGYLRGKNLSANTYAFASVMTFSACTPPLSELLILWDYMFATGIHLNILFIIAQLALIRSELLTSPSPVKILRVLPPLRAKEIINLTNSLCRNLSPELYGKLVRHAYDEQVSDELNITTSTCPNWSEEEDDTNDLPAYMRDAFDTMRKSSESKEDTIDGLLAGMSRELRCSICLFNFQDATSTPCGHTFCNECIIQHLQNKTCCPLCNQEISLDELQVAYSVQAIVEEFKKMRDEFEREREVNLSQVPIQYLSHEDTLEQNTSRSLRVTDSEGPLSEVRNLPLETKHVKVYLGNNLEEIDIPNISYVHKIDEDTTHVVLKAADPHVRDIVELNEQYLLAVLHGCYILDSSWLEKCKEVNSIYPETRFEIAGETRFGRTGAPAKSRKNRTEKKNLKLFRGVRARFVTDDEINKRYEKYVRIGGGTIVSHGEIIVCDEDIDSDELRSQFPESRLLSKDWLDECICAFELVNKDKYIL